MKLPEEEGRREEEMQHSGGKGKRREKDGNKRREKREKDGYIESIGEKTLIEFGNELVNLHIGTPIRRKEDRQTLKQIVSFLKNRSRVFTQSDYYKQMPSDIMDDIDYDQQETEPSSCCKAAFIFDIHRYENMKPIYNNGGVDINE